MRERIQKALAARGVGSRRQVEGWIADGRISVNGKPATAGQPVDERDDIRLDGRRLRLARGDEAPHRGIAYHRPAREEVRGGGESAAGSIEKLPKAGGHRWVPVSPLPARDGGLEVFVTDGALAAALTKRSYAVPGEFSVRVRGAFDESSLGTRLREQAESAGTKGRIDAATPSGGEGRNRWIQVAGTGLRTHDLRELFAACGLEANRILRTRYGPVVMDRALARGRSRALTEGELRSLWELAQAKPPGSRKPARSSRDRPARAGRGTPARSRRRS
jgi:23S rRNA pseudouridine2605 synthase